MISVSPLKTTLILKTMKEHKINRALRLLRTYHNFKQKDLAAKLGVSPSLLSEIEKGTKPVSYDLLERYSSAFGIPVSTITLFSEASAAGTPGKKFFANVTEGALRILEWVENFTKVHDESAGSPQVRPK